MRRLIVIAACTSLLAVALAAPTLAAPREKVTVCHVNGVSDVIPTFNPTTDLRLFYPGRLLTVAARAVPGHVGHGDSATAGDSDGQYRTDALGLANVRQSAADNGLRVWDKADCFITRLPA